MKFKILCLCLLLAGAGFLGRAEAEDTPAPAPPPSEIPTPERKDEPLRVAVPKPEFTEKTKKPQHIETPYENALDF